MRKNFIILTIEITCFFLLLNCYQDEHLANFKSDDKSVTSLNQTDSGNQKALLIEFYHSLSTSTDNQRFELVSNFSLNFGLPGLGNIGLGPSGPSANFNLGPIAIGGNPGGISVGTKIGPASISHSFPIGGSNGGSRQPAPTQTVRQQAPPPAAPNIYYQEGQGIQMQYDPRWVAANPNYSKTVNTPNGPVTVSFDERGTPIIRNAPTSNTTSSSVTPAGQGEPSNSSQINNQPLLPPEISFDQENGMQIRFSNEWVTQNPNKTISAYTPQGPYLISFDEEGKPVADFDTNVTERPNEVHLIPVDPNSPTPSSATSVSLAFESEVPIQYFYKEDNNLKIYYDPNFELEEDTAVVLNMPYNESEASRYEVSFNKNTDPTIIYTSNTIPPVHLASIPPENFTGEVNEYHFLVPDSVNNSNYTNNDGSSSNGSNTDIGNNTDNNSSNNPTDDSSIIANDNNQYSHTNNANTTGDNNRDDNGHFFNLQNALCSTSKAYMLTSNLIIVPAENIAQGCGSLTQVLVKSGEQDQGVSVRSITYLKDITFANGKRWKVLRFTFPQNLSSDHFQPTSLTDPEHPIGNNLSFVIEKIKEDFSDDAIEIARIQCALVSNTSEQDDGICALANL